MGCVQPLIAVADVQRCVLIGLERAVGSVGDGVGEDAELSRVGRRRHHLPVIGLRVDQAVIQEAERHR